MRPIAILVVLPMLLVAFLDAGVARAEDAPSTTTVGECLTRLESDLRREQAWGAYLAGRDGHRELIPQIHALLDQPADKKIQEDRYVHRSALDALLRLDDKTPAALLARNVSRGSTPVLLLQLRDPKTNRALLVGRLRTYLDNETLYTGGAAIGTTLLEADPKGLAAEFLRGLHFTLKVTVRDPGSLGGGGRWLGAGSGDSSARIPEGFPPYVVYRMTYRKTPWAEPLVGGPAPVYVERKERATPGLVTGGGGSRTKTHDIATAWLASLLEVEPESITMPARERCYVDFSDGTAYLAKAQGHAERLVAPFHALVKRLSAEGLLTEAEATAAEPRVHYDVEDRRTDKSVALPPLE